MGALLSKFGVVLGVTVREMVAKVEQHYALDECAHKVIGGKLMIVNR